MHADGGVNPRVFLGQRHRTGGGRHIGANVDDQGNAGRQRPGDHFVAIRVKPLVINVRM